MELWPGFCVSTPQKKIHTWRYGRMKSLTLLRLAGLLVLLISLAGIPLYGQAGQGQQDPAASQSQPSQQDPAASQSQPSMSQESSQGQTSHIFVGKIAKSKGDLVFKDDAGTMYKLDNADQAKSFVGKNVKITGTLDESTKTIHVATIEPPSF